MSDTETPGEVGTTQAGLLTSSWSSWCLLFLVGVARSGVSVGPESPVGSPGVYIRLRVTLVEDGTQGTYAWHPPG